MRIVIDLNRCQGYAQCVPLAPTVLKLNGEEAVMCDPNPTTHCVSSPASRRLLPGAGDSSGAARRQGERSAKTSALVADLCTGARVPYSSSI